MEKLRVLACHNYYRRPGGEDRVFDDEVRLLEGHGHEVARFTVHNDEIRSKIAAAVKTLWNRTTVQRLRSAIEAHRPDIVHFTNTFPLLSPAAYYACRSAGVPVVQAIHNYRLVCPGSLLMRDGQPCEKCLGQKLAVSSIRHKCYRDSRAGTAVVAGMLLMHRAMGTYRHVVNHYYALTEFAKRKLVEGGLPADKISVKPNFVSPDPGPGLGSNDGTPQMLYVGRLSEEKGVHSLLEAWRCLGDRAPRLTIIGSGDGDTEAEVAEFAASSTARRWLGYQPEDVVAEEMGRASAVIVPSICYEGFPKVIVESYARGTPVLASNIGSLTELIKQGETGWMFAPNNPAAMASCVEQFIDRLAEWPHYRSCSRTYYEDEFSSQINYEHLMRIYAAAKADFDGQPDRVNLPRPEGHACIH